MSCSHNSRLAPPGVTPRSRFARRLAAWGSLRTGTVLALVLSAVVGARAFADAGPDSAMMAPVTALASFMAHAEDATRPPVFADDGVVIVENFPPYLFSGGRAADRWGAIFKQHAEDHHLDSLAFTFGKPHDFDRSGDRVYFVLPTRWQGSYQRGDGPRATFDEMGAWTFVLVRKSDRWLILSYAWGVTEKNGA